jgi:hypothetical protein
MLSSGLAEADRNWSTGPQRGCVSATRVRMISCRPGIDAAHAEVFDFEEFLDAVFRTFAADAVSFMPPNGAISVEMMPSLIPTMPYSRASAMRQMRPNRRASVLKR